MGDREAEGITGLVLAGGRARRMQGLDKGLVQFNGKAMAQHVCEQLGPQCQALLINANRNPGVYAQFGYPVIADEMTGYQGPLAGMLAGLNGITTPWMITAPCDGPHVATDYVSRMHHAAVKNRHHLAVAFCRDRLQPVYALIHRDLEPHLRNYLETGCRKIDGWYAHFNYSVVDFSTEPDMFENVNTPEQLQQLEKRH